MPSLSARFLLAAVLSTSSAAAQTGAGPFGPISDFDVWGTTGVEFRHVTLEGRVNGNKYMDLRDFVVAKDTSIAAGEDVVVCGGLLRMRHGTLVNGQSVYQRILDVDKTVVFSNSVVDIRQEDIFSDEDVRRALRHQSISLGILPANGSVGIYGPHIQLTGTRSGLNVFRLQKTQLEAASQVAVDIPSGAAALINVEGGFWDQTQWSLQIQGTPASRVLLNAYEGTHLTLTNAQLGATLLAPRAVVDMDMMGVSGNIIGRYVNLSRAHTLGQRLVGSEWNNSNSANFEPDEDGVDNATYSLVWPEQNPGEQIELQAQGPDGLALVVDGSVKATALRSKISRLVLLGSATPATTSVDPALGIPVEWASSAPVAFDDSASLPRGSRSLAFDPLGNDVGTDLDPSTLEIVAQPLVGSASVDLARGVLRYDRPPTSPPLGVSVTDMPWRFAVVWYRVRDSHGVACQPRRLLIELSGRGGLQRR